MNNKQLQFDKFNNGYGLICSNWHVWTLIRCQFNVSLKLGTSHLLAGWGQANCTQLLNSAQALRVGWYFSGVISWYNLWHSSQSNCVKWKYWYKSISFKSISFVYMCLCIHWLLYSWHDNWVIVFLNVYFSILDKKSLFVIHRLN